MFVALGWLDVPLALLLLALAVTLGVAQSVAAIALEQLAFRRYTRLRDVGLLLLLAVVENLGYRQLTVWWRLQGLVKYLRGRRDWGVMERRGFQPPAPAPQKPGTDR